jgi:N-acyl-D-amino-acid deacylase
VARLSLPADRARLLSEWRDSLVLGWDEVTVAWAPDELSSSAGRSIAAIAADWGVSQADTALDLIVRSDNRVMVIGYGRSEDNLQMVLKDDATSIGSDGMAMDPDGPFAKGNPHPRSFGCHPRFLGRYVRDKGLVSLEASVSMLTARPAERARILGRGWLKVGSYGDIVVFDPETINDRATFDAPTEFPVGIRHVIVNGSVVIESGVQHDDRRPGRVLLRG